MSEGEKKEDKKVEDGVQGLKDMASVLGLMLPIGLLRGLVFSHLWYWFMVPLGAPLIGVMQMSGIMLIVSMVKFRQSNSDDKPKTGMFTRIVFMSVLYLIAWGVGAIFHAWML